MLVSGTGIGSPFRGSSLPLTSELSTSQSRMSRFSPPVASVFPSGENARLSQLSLWPFNRPIGLLVLRSQRLMTPPMLRNRSNTLPQATAKVLPSGENATSLIVSF